MNQMLLSASNTQDNKIIQGESKIILNEIVESYYWVLIFYMYNKYILKKKNLYLQ